MLLEVGKVEMEKKRIVRLSELIDKIWKNIPSKAKIAFGSTIIWGLIAHLYMFMNKLPNYDDIMLNSFGATFRLGRWFLWIVGAIAYHLELVYSLPWFNGLISLSFIAVANALIIGMLQIDNKWLISIVCGLLVVYPSWTGTFFFMFTAPYYALAIVLAVLAVYFVVSKNKFSFVLAIVCLCCSLGIYQAYLPFTAGLLVIILILQLYRDCHWKEVLRNGIRYLAFLILSVGIYYLITRITLFATKQSFADYKGLGELGKFSFADTIKNIFLFSGANIVSNKLEISYNLLLKMSYTFSIVILLVELIITCTKWIKKQRIAEAILLLVLGVCFWTAVNAVYIMCQDESSIYVLMVYSYSLLFILPICVLNQVASVNKSNLIVLTEYVMNLLIVAVVLNYCHFANAEYLAMDLSLQQMESYYTTLITQVKSTQGYTADMPVALIQKGGYVLGDSTLYRNEILDTFRLKCRDDSLVDTYNKECMLAYYLGFQPEYIDANEIDQNIVDRMTVYPGDGSIQVVDGVIVVKLTE